MEHVNAEDVQSVIEYVRLFKTHVLSLTLLYSMLQTDRLIKVYVGMNLKPYLVPTSVLAGISAYFVKALANEDRFAGEKGVMRFPEDDPTSWEALLYYKLRGHVQCARTGDEQQKIMQLVGCWILGDKYNIKDFQDHAMLQLLRWLTDAQPILESVKLAFENTLEGSPLRTLMAREAVYGYYDNRSPDNTAERFKMFDGVQGFMTEFLKAMELRAENDNDEEALRTRLTEQDSWEEFMVGEGPKKHWVWALCEETEFI